MFYPCRDAGKNLESRSALGASLHLSIPGGQCGPSGPPFVTPDTISLRSASSTASPSTTSITALEKNSAKGKNKIHQTASDNRAPSQRRGAELYQAVEHPTSRQHPGSAAPAGQAAGAGILLTFAGDADAVQPGFLRRKETRSQAGWMQTCFVDAFAPQTGGVPMWFVLKHPLLSLRSCGAHRVIRPAELSIPGIF